MSEFGVDLMTPAGWLPLVFALVMALSMLAYVILDGYDLGVGALLDSADSVVHKDIMIASIGPFGMPTKPGWCWVWGCCW